MPTTLLRSTLAILLVVASLSLAPAPRPAQAAGIWYVATTGSDSNDCATPATPCATINAAIGRITSGDTIRIAVGVYTDGGDQVVLLDRSASLSGGWDEAFSAQIGLTTIDGQNARRGMTVGVGSVSRVEHVIIQNGSVLWGNWGGGILNWGSLTLEHSLVHHNTGWGGGIASPGTLIVNASTISQNVSPASGGGIWIPSGSATLNNVTISGNEMGGGGSGGGGGAGIENFGGNLQINSSLITDNRINGFYYGSAIAGSATIRNSIIANNHGTPYYGNNECGGDVVSLGYNVIGSTQTCNYTRHNTDLADVPIGFGPLQDNGGSVPTHALLADSPAINAGDPGGCLGSAGLLSTDQRGMPRIGRCDAGPFETNLLVEKRVTGDYRPGGWVTYTIGLRGADPGVDLAGVMVTDTLPATLVYQTGSLQASQGQAAATDTAVTWSGDVLSHTLTTLTFSAQIGAAVWSTIITNTVTGNWSGSTTSSAISLLTEPARFYLPQASRNYCANLFEDFSSPGSRWYVGDDAGLHAEIDAGEYRLYAKVLDVFLVAAPTCPRQSYIVEADARWAAPSTDSYGLLFGLNADWSRFYLLEVNPHFQGFRVFGYTDTAGFKLITGPYLSSAIRPDTGANHLAVRRAGSEIVIILNGASMDHWFDYDLLDLTRPGLLVLTFDDEPVADARFDNFRVTSLEYNAAALDAGLPNLALAGPTVSRPANVDWPWPTVDQIRRAWENR